MNTCLTLAAIGVHSLFLGCLNSPSLEKSLNGWSSDGHYLYYHLDMARQSSPADQMEKTGPSSDPWDKSVKSILGGDYDGAIAQLEAIEAREPGNYHTAANLGTAYELKGDNEKALHWIKRGIQINPGSHRGTEWLHALILEAKVAAQKGRAIPETQRLMPLPEKLEKETLLEVNGGKRTAAEAFEALSFQLSERLVFVKPKDRWAAECLFSAALLQASFYSVRDGLRLLDIAEEYGFPDAAALSAERSRFQWSIWMGEVQFWVLLVAGGGAGIWIILKVFRRLRDLLSD